jgi:hypothetical protein
MKRIIPFLVLAALCCGAISCNEKQQAKENETEAAENVELITYKFVKNMADGKQIEEQIEAKNDTDALSKFIDRMTKIILEEATAGDDKVKTESMYVISSTGDTLNTNEELMGVIEKQIMTNQPTGQVNIPAKKK